METERVGGVRDGRLHGCFSRDETERRFLMALYEQRKKEERREYTDHG